MANTYKKVQLHIVFAVKNRQAILDNSWRAKVFAYISGIIRERGHYPLAVNGYHDHIHILIEYNLNELIPDLVREIKKSSSKYIKDEKFTRHHFEWQLGYGIFSVGWKEVSTVINYIRNQEIHHQKRSFKNEYQSLLEKYKIDYKDEYVFKFFDE